MGAVLCCAYCAAQFAVCLTCKALCACCPRFGGGGGGGGGETNPDAGRIGSFWLMVCTMVLALAMQYWAAPKGYLDYYAFQRGCDNNACKGGNAVYRVSMSTCILFALCALITRLNPRLHDSLWGVKFMGWLALVAVSMLVPNYVFDLHGYVWAARFGSFVFVVIQQILLIDLAYYVNDELVELADSGEVSTWCGTPTPLIALLSGALINFGLCVGGIVLLFMYFEVGDDGCSNSRALMLTTVALIAVAVLCQLFISKDANLLTSSVVAVYCTYLAAAALTANPVDRCSPFNNKDGWLSIALGIGFTSLSLIYATYSASSQAKYIKDGRREQPNAGVGGPMMNKILTGEHIDAIEAQPTTTTAASAPEVTYVPKKASEVFTFNIVMALMAMMVSMILTNWGSIPKSHSAAKPTAGKAAMWMQASASWTALALYIWTCVAPALFPDRDFS